MMKPLTLLLLYCGLLTRSSVESFLPQRPILPTHVTTNRRPLHAAFDGADSLLDKIQSATIGNIPPPPEVVKQAVEGVTSDPTTNSVPSPDTIVDKVADVAASSAANTAPDVTSTAPSVTESLPSVDLPSVGLDLPLPVIGGIVIAFLLINVVGSFVGGEKKGETTTTSMPASSPAPPPAPAPAPPTPSPSPSAVTSNTSSETDLSIPYDAAAMLAYEKAGKPGDFDSFKAKYKADAIADVKAKQKKS